MGIMRIIAAAGMSVFEPCCRRCSSCVDPLMWALMLQVLYAVYLRYGPWFAARFQVLSPHLTLMRTLAQRLPTMYVISL